METKKCNRCGRELPNTNQYFPMENEKTRTICKECDSKYGRFLKDGEVSPKRWSQKDIEILKVNYCNFTNEELHQLFFPNRSVRAIESYASKIGCIGKSDSAKERATRNGVLKNNQKGKKFTEKHKENISKAKKRLFNPDKDDIDGIAKAKRLKKIIGQSSSKRWIGEKNPRHLYPLCGSDNGRWKGGIVPLSKHLREEILGWKNRSMEFCEYRCVVTGGRFDDIHHITPMSDIIDMSLRDLGLSRMSVIGDYSSDDYLRLKNDVVKKHETTEYGCCLNKKIHMLFHSLYGYTGNNVFQLTDFFVELSNHDFDDYLLHNNLELNIDQKYFNYIMEVRNDCLRAS